MIFSFINKSQLQTKQKKPWFKTNLYYWFIFIIFDKFITNNKTRKKNKIKTNISLYFSFYNTNYISAINYYDINHFQQIFYLYIRYICSHNHKNYFKFITKIIFYYLLFSKKQKFNKTRLLSITSLNNYRFIYSNFIQNKEFLNYSVGNRLQLNSIFRKQKQQQQIRPTTISQNFYIKKYKNLKKKRINTVLFTNKTNKWFNIQRTNLIDLFKLKYNQISFPTKMIYHFKKYKLKKIIKNFLTKKKVSYITKIKNKKFVNNFDLQMINKYYLIYFIKNNMFNVNKDIIGQKLYTIKIFNWIKKYNNIKYKKIRFKSKFNLKKKYNKNTLTWKNKYKNKLKSYRLKYQLNLWKKNSENYYCIIIKTNKNLFSQKNKKITFFNKLNLDYNLFFNFQINILKKGIINNKSTKFFWLLFRQKCRNIFFYRIHYKYYKHNSLKHIYVNKWKYRSYIQWIWLSKNIIKIKYKHTIINKNRNKFKYYSFFIVNLLYKNKKNYYLKKNYINNLLKWYQIKRILKLNQKNIKLIYNVYSKKIKNNNDLINYKKNKVSNYNDKFTLNHFDKNNITNSIKNKTFFQQKIKSGFYFKSVIFPQKQANIINFNKIKNILSLLLNNRISLYYINVISLTRLAFDDRAKKSSIKYRAFVLKYSIIPRSFILNKIVKVKTSNIYLKKLIRNIERRYLYVAIFIKDIVRITFFCIFLKKTSFLVNFYAYSFSKLTRKYKETVFIRFLIKILKSATINRKEIIGVRLRFKGRINRWRRTKYIIGQKGIWNYNSIRTIVDYAQSSAVTKKGMQGFSIWLCYKSNFITTLRITFLNYIRLSKKKLNN